MDKAKIIARAQKIRALAEDKSATEGEVNAALEALNRLMAEHEISMVDLTASARREDDPIGYSTFEMEGRARVHPVVQFVWRGLQEYTDTVVYTQGAAMKVFGHKSDCTTAVTILAMLVNVSDVEYHRWFDREIGLRGTGGRKPMNSFMRAFAGRVSERMMELKRARDKVMKETTGRDLVVAKRSQVEHVFKQQGTNLTMTRSTHKRHSQAYGAGRAAGDRFDLGGSKLGGSGRMISQQ